MLLVPRRTESLLLLALHLLLTRLRFHELALQSGGFLLERLDLCEQGVRCTVGPNSPLLLSLNRRKVLRDLSSRQKNPI